MYKDLGESFYQNIRPSKISNPKLILLNKELFKNICPELENSKKLDDILSGKELYFSNDPLAMVYAGHQFGNFNPRLGDGRAVLLGERDRLELHLKGSGPTMYSRGGDGLCPLGPALREYIISMSMKNLNIKTTETLSVCLTGEDVYRDEILPAANLIRVAQSHIRVGTFEYFFYQNDFESIKKLADYSIEKMYPGLDYLSFFKQVAKNQISLINSWMSIGFIHGVMNTDNCLISGETIDYGPCAFMDEYKYDQWFSSIDRNGRYRYSNQMNIILWNLSCLATALSPLINKKEDDLNKFWKPIFNELEIYQDDDWTSKMLKKFGLSQKREGDKEMIISFLRLLENEKMDFTNSFRNLEKTIDRLKSYPEIVKIKQRLLDSSNELRDQVNPYLIPRNYLVDEAILDCYHGKFEKLENLLSAIEKPYDTNNKWSDLTKEKSIDNYHTFCGT